MVDIVADHRIVLPDGTVKHIHGISHPVFDETGQVIEYVGTEIDVTDRNQQSITFRTELDGALPSISADRVQLQQVLMNLMLNDMEAMKDTRGELTITSKITEDGKILLSVRDLGSGFPGDKAERIFDAFFTTKAQGTGMGLSISRRIIESHGGRLWASANSGRGATFDVALPVAPEPGVMPAKEA